MTIDELLKKLEELGSPDGVAGMARFAIVSDKSFGISAPVLKELAREAQKVCKDRHELALGLWQTGIYEARQIACLIDDPKRVTRAQMDAWVKDFDNWAIVDGACGHLFCRTPFAYEKAFEWAEREPEFEKRAGFSLMCYLAVHDKKAADEKLSQFLPVIEKHSDDPRNFVKKAVNWALRQIGKRNLSLNRLAIDSAEKIQDRNTPSSRWIASDALRELNSVAVRERLITKRKRVGGQIC